MHWEGSFSLLFQGDIRWCLGMFLVVKWERVTPGIMWVNTFIQNASSAWVEKKPYDYFQNWVISKCFIRLLFIGNGVVLRTPPRKADEVIKSFCCQSWWSEFEPRNLRDENRQLSPTSCPPTSTHALWHVGSQRQVNKTVLHRKCLTVNVALGNRSVWLYCF